MKKALTISLIPVLVFFIFGAFTFVDAQTSPTEQCTIVRALTINNEDYNVNDTVGPVGSGSTHSTEDWGTVCLVNTINTVVDWIFIFLIAISVALIAIAGFIYMTAGASPEKQKLAGKMIMGAVIGIVIAILARVLPALITGILI